jgi:hypothetical protein
MADSQYSAGALNLEILGVSDNAIASIDRTVKSLNALSRSIKKINQTQFAFAGDKIEVLFTKIAKATNSINATNLNNLASATKSLSSISKIGNLEKVDWSKVAVGFGNLTTAITPFLNKVKEAEASLTAMYGILSKTSGKKIQNLLGDSSTKSGNRGGGLSSFLTLSKWTAIIYSAKRLGSLVGNIAQKGADYTETLNLWQVAMGNNLNAATKFVNKMNEAYGISEKTLMNAQAIFKNMLGSLGQISEEQAYILSEGVTQMALDYASLYNQTFDQAFTKFQAALAGQVRPIRSVAGYDITENTLFQLYQSLGGEKTMRQLSRTEKQLLSIYAIFRQMDASGAVGDLDKTMESFANQSRVMKESWNDVISYAGVLLTYLLQEYNVLQYINAVLIFFAEILKGVVTSLDAIQEFNDPFASTTEGANEASDAVDELNGKLLSFDKFRALNESEDTNALGLDIKLIEALKEYDSILEGANFEARKLAEQWLTNLGLIDENNDGIIDMQLSIITVDKLLRNINWGVIGEGFANYINSIDFYQLGVKLWEILSSIGAGLGDAIVEAILSIDWFKVIKESISSSQYKINSLFEDLHLDEMLSDLFENNLLVQIFELWEELTTGKSKGKIRLFADGGLPDKGSMFIAGEAGAEYVYNMPNGQSGVANVQQIAQATYQGTMSALRDWWGGTGAKGDIPQLREANATGMYQAVTGVAKSYGEKWSNY